VGVNGAIDFHGDQTALHRSKLSLTDSVATSASDSTLFENSIPSAQRRITGLIRSKRPELEPLDLLRRRVDEAARYIALDHLGVSPQCGFASSVGGNPLSLDDERRKLARVVELADAVWG
jgi:methionine synthase II (cobalamin-independent)